MLKPLLAALLLAFVVAGSAAAFLFWRAHAPFEFPGDRLEIEIRAGSSVRSSGRQLEAGGLPLPWWQFEWIARVSGQVGLKAGTYEIKRGTSPLDLLGKMVRGDVVLVEVRLIEGWTFRQFRQALARERGLRQDTADWDEPRILQALGVAAPSAEGLFFPDTYQFSKHSSDLAVLKLAYAAMQRQLATVWAERAATSPLRSPYEALILASIVEKETGRAEDRPLVASVFQNRLRIGMLLQTDPTVIYGLGEGFDGNLRKRDLINDTPYNTYTRPGLPPTPIAMPGLASLRAAVSAPVTDAFYFVGRGDGTSHFSRSLEEHNRAVAKYQSRR